VLVKVIAAGVNPLDNMISRGEVKIIVPYKLPQVAGNEVVGIIEQKGSNVANFEIGDRVFSRLPLDKIGAFAEYVAVNQDTIAKVPHYLTDEEAAAVPLTALTIMQALELMGAESGKTIFISGGTGGVGGMAIPIAKAKGLTVITNGSVENKERVEKLGVDGVILTKLDGTAKGGIVIAIKKELGIPVKLVGLGENIDDLEVFDPEQYIYGLFYQENTEQKEEQAEE